MGTLIPDNCVSRRKVSKKVLVLDEPNPADLLPKRGFSPEVLLAKSKEYEGVTQPFLTDLLETTAATRAHQRHFVFEADPMP